MGTVFAAEHRYLGHPVAIKVLHGSYAGNPNITQRFFQEAKSTALIGHPGIVKVLDFGQAADGSLYLVMELLSGESLRHAMSQRTFDEATTARIGAAVADAVGAAHAKSIIHRDLKPDNVFLVGDAVKVLDFGVAEVMSSSTTTRTGALLGSPQYMAP